MVCAVVVDLAEVAAGLVGVDRVVVTGADVVVRIEPLALTEPLVRIPPAANAVADNMSDKAQIAALAVTGFSLRVFMRNLLSTQQDVHLVCSPTR